MESKIFAVPWIAFLLRRSRRIGEDTYYKRLVLHVQGNGSSSTSRYDSEKRKFQPIASRIISGSNCRHLKRPKTGTSKRGTRLEYLRLTLLKVLNLRT